MVYSSWTNYDGNDTASKYLFNKLKAVKRAIIEWRHIEFEKECKAILETKSKVQGLDRITEIRIILDSERVELGEGKKKILELENLLRLNLHPKIKNSVVF